MCDTGLAEWEDQYEDSPPFYCENAPPVRSRPKREYGRSAAEGAYDDAAREELRYGGEARRADAGRRQRPGVQPTEPPDTFDQTQVNATDAGVVKIRE